MTLSLQVLQKALLVIVISFAFIRADTNTTTTTTEPTTLTTTTPQSSFDATSPSNNSTSASLTTTNLTTTISSSSSSSSTPNQTGNKCEHCNPNGATCAPENNVCKCKSGYHGQFCDYIGCDKNRFEYDQCLHGTCVTHFSKTDELKCICHPGYAGGLCEEPVCKDYCYNNGRCDDNLGSSGLTENSSLVLSCDCAGGADESDRRFTGQRCEFDKCFSQVKEAKCPANCTLDGQCKCLCNKECDSYLCNKEKGVCYEKQGQVACKCNIGYSGPTCLVNECSGYCFNGGSCLTTNSTYYCSCPDHYNGTRCEHFLEPVSSKNKQPGSSSSSWGGFFYGFSIVLLLCGLAMAGYVLISKGYLSNVRDYFSRHSLGNGHGSASSRGMEFVRTNFNFNKLEDEQSITQNELHNI